MTFHDGLCRFVHLSQWSSQKAAGLTCHAQLFAAPLPLFPRPGFAVHEPHQTRHALCTCQGPSHAAFAFCRSTSQWKVI